MEQNGSGGQERRVWERVSPSLEPYPEDGMGRRIPEGAVVRSVTGERIGGPPPASGPSPAARPAPPVPAPHVSAPPAPEPPRRPDIGAEPEELKQFIEAERSEQRHLSALSRQSPAWARRELGQVAAACGERARRLSAAYYLLTGEAYRGGSGGGRVYVGRWAAALRERWQSLSRLGRRYSRAAGEARDPFLKDLLNELGAGAYRNARTLLRLLEQGMESAPPDRR